MMTTRVDMRIFVYWFCRSVLRVKRTVTLVVLAVLMAFLLWSLRLNRYQEYPELNEIQVSVDYIAQYMDIRFRNLGYAISVNHCSRQEISLTNTGLAKIKADWIIYLKIMTKIDCCPNIHRIFINKSSSIMEDNGFQIYHVEGTLYSIKPNPDVFVPIGVGETRTVRMYRNYQFVSKFKVFPNWYVTSENNSNKLPRVIKSTIDENLGFVESFNSSYQYRLNRNDKNNPLTPRQRFQINQRIPMTENLAVHVIPEPLSVKIINGKSIGINTQEWTIYTDSQLLDEAKYLSAKTKIPLSASVPVSKFIQLSLEPEGNLTEEEYQLAVQLEKQSVNIVGKSHAGVFYAIQTLLSLLTPIQGDLYSLPNYLIKDKPRFQYRGVHLDVARNFMTKEAVIRLLDVMAMYKLNKFHFHLSDDEGWRLEIPGLPELTEFASRRCHNLNGEQCLMPQFASGPFNTNSGFYTTDDYREILQFAKSRHIQVIPEIDLPGHARAAIKAMELRYKGIISHKKKYKKYLLSEKNDKSVYQSVQLFNDGFINVCINSTYNFIHHIIKTLRGLHSDIQPLSLYHIGGDEIVEGAWKKSPACKNLTMSLHTADYKLYFVKRSLKILGKQAVNIAFWEDAVFKNIPHAYSLKELLGNYENISMYAYLWNNQWEVRRAYRAISLANAGYKVVMSQSTHLYLDHPYEFDPEELGNGWSTPAISTQKIFNFKPMHIYKNADVDLEGHKLNPAERKCPSGIPCALKRPENIVGMQGHLWTEFVPTTSKMFYMYFPRILAVAERSWHKASWEDTDDVAKQSLDWSRFTSIVGMKELNRLDNLNIDYRVPTPGAIIEHGILYANCEFPGLHIQYSTDNGIHWSDVPMTKDGYWKGIRIYTDRNILVQTLSTDRRRTSRVISMPGLA